MPRLRDLLPGIPTIEVHEPAQDALTPPPTPASRAAQHGRGLKPAGNGWIFDHGTSSDYADIEGGSYHFLRTTRAAKDGVSAGDWVVCHRLKTSGTADADLLFGLALIHKVFKRGDDRYAVYERYLALEPPISFAKLRHGDPRPTATNPITPVPLSFIEEILELAGVKSLDDIPITMMRLGVEDVQAEAPQLRIPRSVIEECVAALRAGKHLILRGPPGTGKSSLAIALVEAAHRVGISSSAPLITTGTADWTATDTVGGYRLDPNRGPVGSLVFTPGYLVESVDSGAWLVIDELNRADIDKAIGQFFSVLSGQPVVLPFLDQRGRRIGVSPPGTISRAAVDVPVAKNWRLITTMNERDRDLLFNLSEAFLRRFAVVEVPAPTEEAQWAWILANRARVRDPDLAARLHALTQLDPPGLGPAIVIDCALYLEQRLALLMEQGETLDAARLMGSAIETLVAPQLAGLLPRERDKARRDIEKYVTGATVEQIPSAVATTSEPQAPSDSSLSDH